MRERLLTLARDGVPDNEIATILTEEGHRSPRCADKVLPITVGRLRRAAAIKIAAQRSRWEHDDSLLSPPELARRLEIPVNWLYVQIRTKRLLIDRQLRRDNQDGNPATIRMRMRRCRGDEGRA